MTFFVDANIFIYAAEGDPRTEACERIVDAVVSGAAAGKTSVAVLEEIWHIELSRGSVPPGTCDDLAASLGPVLSVGAEELSIALGLDVVGPGANDRLHAATCLTNDISTVVSADRDFDEFEALVRVDPLDAGAVEELLR